MFFQALGAPVRVPMFLELVASGRRSESNVAAETLPIAERKVLDICWSGLVELYVRVASIWTVAWPPGISNLVKVRELALTLLVVRAWVVEVQFCLLVESGP